MKELLLLLFVMSFAMSCEKKNDDLNNSDCNQDLVVSKTDYDAVSSSAIVFIDAIEWTGECIDISIGYSGCDDGHEMLFVTDGGVDESFPPQVHFAIQDKNPEACAAAFLDSYSFGIDAFDVFEQYDEVIIHFKNADTSFTWKK